MEWNINSAWLNGVNLVYANGCWGKESADMSNPLQASASLILSNTLKRGASG